MMEETGEGKVDLEGNEERGERWREWGFTGRES
jgi:hypothetical protein